MGRSSCYESASQSATRITQSWAKSSGAKGSVTPSTCGSLILLMGQRRLPSGLPLFGTLIGYLRRGAACVGVIGAHALHETVFAASGQGCWYQREGGEPKRLRTSGVTDPAQAFAVSTSLEHTDMDPRHPMPAVRLSHLYRQARRFRWSGDCINYALLCQGSVDVALDSRIHPWDIAAVAACVRGAGGVLTSFDGNEDVVWQSDLVASANITLHRQVLRLLGSD